MGLRRGMRKNQEHLGPAVFPVPGALPFHSQRFCVRLGPLRLLRTSQMILIPMEVAVGEPRLELMPQAPPPGSPAGMGWSRGPCRVPAPPTRLLKDAKPEKPLASPSLLTAAPGRPVEPRPPSSSSIHTLPGRPLPAPA